MLERSAAIYSQCGESHRAGRCQLNLATIAEQQGNLHRAAALIEKALRRLDFEQEPNLELVVRHNQMTILSELDPPGARRALARWRHLYRERGKASLLRRLPWLEGKIALGHGELSAAELHFRGSADLFLKERSLYTWSLVSLDLAMVYALQRRRRRVLELAEKLWATFQSLSIHQEAFAALLLFLRAARDETLTLELIRQTAFVLRQPAPRRERKAS